MKLTRKFLSTLGIEEEKADQIINVHVETVDNLKDEIEKYRADAEKLPNVQKELGDIKAEIAKNDGKNPYEVKYNAIKEEFEKYKMDVQKRESTAQKSNAFRKLLQQAGVAEKRIDAVLRVSDVDGIKIGEDGTIEGESELMESIKKEWSDFITTEEAQGVKTANPPSSTTKTAMTKDEILKIKDSQQRQAAIADNHELFGF